MVVRCPTPAVPEEQIVINECGDTLTSSTAIFSWTDPFFNANTVYDFWVGSTPLSDDVYDLSGGGVFNNNSINVGNIPTDGRTLYKTLYVFRNGPDGGITDTIQCTCTAAQVEQYKASASFPSTDIPFGSVTESDFESYFEDTDGATSIPFGVETLNNVSIFDGCMRVKFDPVTTNGTTASTRTIFQGNLPDSPCYCIEQTVRLEGANFDFGGQPGNQTIKLGFGIGFGSVALGGAGNDPCGASFRWILRGNEIMGYSYAYGRPANTNGQDIPTSVIMNPDQDYDLKMITCKNTGSNSDGSYELFINGNLVASDNAVLWMDHTQCPTESSNTMDTLLFNAFYGGTNSNTQSWWPDSTQYIEFCAPCYTAIE